MSDEQFTELRLLLMKVLEREKAIAKSTADIALGLNHEAIAERDRHAELQGLLLGMLSHDSRRKRKDSIEDTSKFQLPGGEHGDHVQLTRHTQKKILKWAVAAILLVGQFLIHAWLERGH